MELDLCELEATLCGGCEPQARSSARKLLLKTEASIQPQCTRGQFPREVHPGHPDNGPYGRVHVHTLAVGPGGFVTC